MFNDDTGHCHDCGSTGKHESGCRLLLDLNHLIITQHELRYHEQLPLMIEFVKNGGIWSEALLKEYALKHNLPSSPLINISQFEDDRCYIHDGHHRAVATLLGGRKTLYPEEYRVKKWTYEQYLEINFSVGWVTPYDPRTHCRKPDLAEFKDIAKKLAFKEFILTNLDAYAEPRLFSSVAELAEKALTSAAK